MAGFTSIAQAQQVYGAYQQYTELDKQYDLTHKALAGGDGPGRGPGAACQKWRGACVAVGVFASWIRRWTRERDGAREFSRCSGKGRG